MEPTPLTDALMDRAAPALTADQPPLLEARDISKYFGAVVAIEGVSLSVRAGDVPSRRQRRGQVDADQDAVGRVRA
jgi:hypothetical protein